MKKTLALLWFRNDLRLHDHEALIRAMGYADEIIPVYIFDPRQFGKTRYGFAKTGAFRARFMLESVSALRERLRQKGSELLIRWGRPEELLSALVEEHGAKALFAHKEVAYEELGVEQRLEQSLFAKGIEVQFVWGATLYHLADLPMPVKGLPEVFTEFRKQVERYAAVREEFETPATIATPALEDAGELPSWDMLGLEPPVMDDRAALSFKGGEIAALGRLQHYFWEEDRLKEYKETRNGLLGADYSSKFSPWLALGCLSPRKIFHEVQRYEELRKKNSSTYWIVFELIWRDYFRFIGKKHGNALFHRGGLKGQARDLREDWELFDRWREGMTGIPFVDANMRELKLTGFMSNRGRQNVASFLVNDLGIDWRMGAEYFESMLLDYDVCSNWGNWNYVAGVGNDPREGRYFNILSQSRRYDPQGAYLRHWLPELQKLPSNMIHAPYEIMGTELVQYGVEIGKDYPHPVSSWVSNREN